MNLTELVETFKEAQKSGPQPYDTQASVQYIEGDTAWVSIPGSEDVTPVNMTIAAKEGDTVQVRVSGGTAFLVGNATAPPTDDTQAYVAQSRAEEVQADLNEQKEYFWHDDDGAHIQGNLSGYRNDLKSDGMHIVEVATGQDVAMFTADGSRVGKESGNNIEISSTAITGHNDDGIGLFDVSMDGASMATMATEYQGFRLSVPKNATRTYTFTIQKDDITSGKAIVLHCYIQEYQSPKSYFDIQLVKGTSATGTGGGVADYSYDGNVTVSFSVTNPLGVPVEFSIMNYSYGTQIDAPSYTFGTRVDEAGGFSSVLGNSIIAKSDNQTAIGKYNVADSSGNYAFIIGNGTAEASRSNALTVKWDGTVDTAKGQLTAQATTTTWTAPTASGATSTAGGYYAEGKHVYVSISCTLNSAGSSGDNITLFTGLTAPLFMVPLEVMVANTRNGVAWINDSGELHFRPSASVSTSNAVIINGHYTSA